jgi:hypothetical protein
MNGVTAEFAADLQLAPVGQTPRLVGVNAERQEIDVEQGLIPIPAGRVLLAGHDAPWPARLDQLGEAEAKIRHPVAGGMERVVPKRRRPAAARVAFAVEEPLVAAVELGRLHARPEAWLTLRMSLTRIRCSSEFSRCGRMRRQRRWMG